MISHKLLLRVDGSHKLGMGDVVSTLNLVKKLEDFEILFVSKYKGGVDKIKRFNYNVKKIPESINLEEEIKIIKKINTRFKADIIIIFLIREDYQDYCKEICKLAKTMIIDFFGDIEIYSDILVNWDILPEKQHYIKKNKNTIYCLGPKYFILKEEFNKYCNLNKIIKDEVKNVLITMGGSDSKNLTPKIIDSLKNFKKINFNVVIGPAFKNKDKIMNMLNKNDLNFNLINNPNDICKFIFDSDLVISSGGNTSFELAAMKTPFISISNAIWEIKRLKKMEKIGICKYVGDWTEFNKGEIYTIFENLVNNKKERERMSYNCKGLVDGKGIERLLKLISC